MKSIEKLSARVDFNELLDNLDPVSLVPPEEDLLPEFCTYKDEGCEIAPSCLECPLPKCLLEISWGRFKENKTQKYEQIRLVYVQSKITRLELSKRFNVSLSTVKRALKGVEK